MQFSFEHFFLALAGYAFHLLKQYYESVKRKQSFDKRLVAISIVMNLLAIAILIYLLPGLPPEFFVMSPLTAVIIGGFANSILSALMDARKPKIEPDAVVAVIAPPGIEFIPYDPENPPAEYKRGAWYETVNAAFFYHDGSALRYFSGPGGNRPTSGPPA